MKLSMWGEELMFDMFKFTPYSLTSKCLRYNNIDISKITKSTLMCYLSSSKRVLELLHKRGWSDSDISYFIDTLIPTLKKHYKPSTINYVYGILKNMKDVPYNTNFSTKVDDSNKDWVLQEIDRLAHG